MANVKTETEVAGEFKRNWQLLVAAFVGVTVGLTAVPFYSYGLFVAPLEAEFGWTRQQSQLPMIFQTLGVLIAIPFLGGICDKFGARRVALTSLVLFALAFASFALQTGPVWQYCTIALVLGITGAGTLPITWTRVIVGAFDVHRGKALGIILMGTGLTGFLVSKFVPEFIEADGWRMTFVWLACLPILIGWPVVYFMFKDKSGDPVDTNSADSPYVYGPSIKEAISDKRFWLIAIAFMAISCGIGGSIPNLPAFYAGAGFTGPMIGAVMSTIGLSVIFGRIATGLLLDRFWAPGVAAILMSLPAISCFLLASGTPSIEIAYLSSILIGLAAGAEFDIIAYLASRYFGTRNYSKIYSYLWAAFAIGAAVAPSILGAVYDATGGYETAFVALGVIFIVGSLMLLPLGKYPVFATTKAEAEAQENKNKGEAVAVAS
ncbi:MFS transporter [Pseudocolwellia sp. HL-MZ7]|uniref:MFS transporter n=1 Tax=Pseudocolwellia sp. HL-MZ7 TaxID=3400627 RepID=UPI003CEB9B80